MMVDEKIPEDMVVLLDRLTEKYDAVTVSPTKGGNMTLRDYLTELKEFLSEWSGKLAAVAAIITSVITAIPPEWAGLVLGFMPEGPLRLVLALALAIIVLVLPKMAKKKDEKLAEATDGTKPE